MSDIDYEVERMQDRTTYTFIPQSFNGLDFSVQELHDCVHRMRVLGAVGDERINIRHSHLLQVVLPSDLPMPRPEVPMVREDVLNSAVRWAWAGSAFWTTSIVLFLVWVVARVIA